MKIKLLIEKNTIQRDAIRKLARHPETHADDRDRFECVLRFLNGFLDDLNTLK